MNPKNKGFTLIELLVVIAIISLLTSVILASLKSARLKAQDAKIVSELHQIETSLELYYNDNGKYPTPAAGSYCIAATNNCLVAGFALSNGLLSTAISTFTYKPSSSFLIDGTERGFIYLAPVSGPPLILFATNKGGASQLTVGIWKTTSSY